MMSLAVHAQPGIMVSRSGINHIHINRIKTSKSYSLLYDGPDMITSMPRIKPVIPRNDSSLYVVY